MPRTFREASDFLKRVRNGEDPVWHYDYSKPNSRRKHQRITHKIHEGETSRDGYRVLWVHSSAKQAKEASAREQRLRTAEARLEELAPKLNRYRLKTRDQIVERTNKLISASGSFLAIEIIDDTHTEKVKVCRGRPGPNTQYREQTTTTYRLEWHRDKEEIARACRTDGLFPLIDNTDLEPLDVLHTYKKQPFLEKRFYTKKSILEVAPVFLKSPHRIEAMLFLYFIALMIVSLIERNLRNEMKAQDIVSLPILPTGLKTKAPTWNNLQTFFSSVHISMVMRGNDVVAKSIKGVTKLHEQLLLLLKVPTINYTHIKDGWWNFAPQ